MSKTTAQINKQIALITRAGAQLDAFIQETAVDVITHYAAWCDTGLVNRLYLGMPKGARKAALTEWLLAFCAVVPNLNKATAKEQPFIHSKDKVTDVEGGTAKKWYECKPDAKPADVFDFQRFVKQALKKYGEAEITTMTAEQAHALAALAGMSDADVPTRPVKAKAEPAIVDAEEPATVDAEEPLNAVA